MVLLCGKSKTFIWLIYILICIKSSQLDYQWVAAIVLYHIFFEIDSETTYQASRL